MRVAILCSVFLVTLLSAQTAILKTRGFIVSPDVAAQAAKWKRVEIPYNDKALSARERQMVEKLVEASQYINRIYWRQSDPQGLQLYLALEPSAAGAKAQNPSLPNSGTAGSRALPDSADSADRDVLKMLRVNGSRYDLLNDNKTLACKTAEYIANANACPSTPPGRALYPAGITREQIEQYVAARPEQKA